MTLFTVPTGQVWIVKELSVIAGTSGAGLAYGQRAGSNIRVFSADTMTAGQQLLQTRSLVFPAGGALNFYSSTEPLFVDASGYVLSASTFDSLV